MKNIREEVVYIASLDQIELKQIKISYIQNSPDLVTGKSVSVMGRLDNGLVCFFSLPKKIIPETQNVLPGEEVLLTLKRSHTKKREQIFRESSEETIVEFKKLDRI